MSIPPEVDRAKLAEAALAILGLAAFRDRGVTRAWKGLDWDLLALLHEKGWISDPHGKAKSVVLSDESARLAAEMLRRHFT